MSKPWFLKMTMEAEPTPLAGQIAQILKSTPAEIKPVNEVVNGLSKLSCEDAAL